MKKKSILFWCTKFRSLSHLKGTVGIKAIAISKLPAKTSPSLSFSAAFLAAFSGFPLAAMSCNDLLTASLDRAGTASLLWGAANWAFEALEILDISNFEGGFKTDEIETKLATGCWGQKRLHSKASVIGCENDSKLLKWKQIKQFDVRVIRMRPSKQINKQSEKMTVNWSSCSRNDS